MHVMDYDVLMIIGHASKKFWKIEGSKMSTSNIAFIYFVSSDASLHCELINCRTCKSTMLKFMHAKNNKNLEISMEYSKSRQLCVRFVNKEWRSSGPMIVQRIVVLRLKRRMVHQLIEVKTQATSWTLLGRETYSMKKDDDAPNNIKFSAE